MIGWMSLAAMIVLAGCVFAWLEGWVRTQRARDAAAITATGSLALVVVTEGWASVAVVLVAFAFIGAFLFGLFRFHEHTENPRGQR